MNLTAAQAAASGFLTAARGDQGGFPLATAITFGPGQMRSNNVIVELADNGTGQVVVFNSSNGTVHMILDVEGYFE